MLGFITSLAFASGVVINGEAVDEETIRGLRLTGVDVVVDAEGTIHITAPNIGVLVPSQSSPPPPSDVAQTALPTEGVWLVAQDLDSKGHTVVIELNGAEVATFQSGQPALPVHLDPILQPGNNSVTLRASSANAGGGTFYILVAKGTISNAEMRLETPDIQFGLGPNRSGSYERNYTLQHTP